MLCLDFWYRLRRFRETGISARYIRRWVPEKPPCMASSFVFSVGMEYTGALFLLLLIAVLLSLLILIAEIMSFKLVKRTRKEKLNLGSITTKWNQIITKLKINIAWNINIIIIHDQNVLFSVLTIQIILFTYTHLIQALDIILAYVH